MKTGDAASELDVEGARVLEDEAAPERALGDVEGQERRVAQGREGPLVGVGHELDGLRAQNAVRVRVPLDRHLLVGHEPPGGHELGVEPGAHEEVVVGRVAGPDVAVEDAVLPEQVPRRVAKGGRLGLFSAHPAGPGARTGRAG